MQKIVPFEIDIQIEKSKLTKKLWWRDELEDFKKLTYIKERLEDFFPITSSKKTIAVERFWKKLIWMDTLITHWEKEWKEYLFITLWVWTTKALEDWEHKIIDDKWKILYEVAKWSNVISNFFCYITFNQTEDSENIYLNWNIYLLTRWIETIRHELEDLLQKVVYEKRWKVTIKNTLTSKDIKAYKDKIKSIEIIWTFKNNNEFFNLDSLENEKIKKMKMWFFIKWAWILDTLQNKDIKKAFIKPPEIKAQLRFWKTQQTADLDIDTLHISLKEDIIKTKEQFTFIEFKNDCLHYAFWIWKTYDTIK